jgi:hypothetical protein
MKEVYILLKLGNSPVAFPRSGLRLLVTANFVPSLPIIVILVMEAILCSETSVSARETWRNTPEDVILNIEVRKSLP